MKPQTTESYIIGLMAKTSQGTLTKIIWEERLFKSDLTKLLAFSKAWTSIKYLDKLYVYTRCQNLI